MQARIRLLQPDEHHQCELILRGLPEWFGIEDALVKYVRDIQSMQTWGIESRGEIAGFLTLNRHNTHSAEIHVMAVGRTYHGRGLGRQLIEHVE